MKPSRTVGFSATLFLLAATIAATELSNRRNPDFLAAPLDQIDREILGWQAYQDHTLPSGVIRRLDPTSYLSRTYRKDKHELDLFIAFYAEQRAGESMHSPKHCLPGSGWEIWKHGSAFVPYEGKMVEINNYSIHHTGRRMRMYYWYQSRDRIIASEYLGKLMLARDALFAGYTSGSIVRIMLPDDPMFEQTGIDFSAALMPQVARAFGKRPTP
jgi:EpsI family protein